MDNYQLLYRLHVQHEYFEGISCTAIGCRLSPESEELVKQRGLLFRQTAVDEWTILYNKDGADLSNEDEHLLLELYLTDSNFPLYTLWADFSPSAAYELNLPIKEEVIQAVNAIKQTDKRRKIGTGFCTIALDIAKVMQETAPVNTLHFHAKSIKWEYLFFLRNGQNLSAADLKLEDTNNAVLFEEMKAVTEYGNSCMKTTSKEAIPIRAVYQSKLRLVQQVEGRSKRLLLAHIEPPVPGRFAVKDVLRQICYY